MDSSLFFFGSIGSCLGWELTLHHLHGPRYLAYGGAPLLALGFAAHWLGLRLSRPRTGRVLARVTACAVLVVYGAAPLAFAADVAVDRACVETWGGLEGSWFFLSPSLAPVSAALCALAAVRVPRHRLRALLLGRPSGGRPPSCSRWACSACRVRPTWPRGPSHRWRASPPTLT
ncbi:hypothetical protein [Nonomuraea gerenzanensis]|uniref:Uncharacterized protein n=1 Tax=Nonomuraea gerenzanensis TaxID=93944 RepID=A0A1M4E7N2_9ACTN|nr:hypothetical protein [Nonomuraea gerenzanensis]UBU17013.1 hypothetical protein LCN96_18940 [Nonomuraea gerenzanensis]SBO94744.1 hypothetical protein BN4615_P4260 [Nonomuraea gerenzanensis]